jgi:hypothetical protein
MKCRIDSGLRLQAYVCRTDVVGRYSTVLQTVPGTVDYAVQVSIWVICPPDC